jgi:hypothetical protein
MMEEQGGRRQLFTTGGVNVEATAEKVSNQLIQTTNAQVNQIERKSQQRRADRDAIVQGATSIFQTGQAVKQQADKRALLSAQTELEKVKLEYENQVSEGGLIDKENIPYEQKLAKKNEAYNNLKLKLAAIKNTLGQQKNLLSKILGTEKDFESALANYDNEATNLLNQADRMLVAEAKRADKAVAVGNTKSIIESVSNANNWGQVDKITKTAINSLDNLVKQGYLTKAEQDQALNDLTSQVNNRKVDIDINNLQDLAVRGLTEEAEQRAVQYYESLRTKKRYQDKYGANTQVNQIENETKLRNFILGLQKANTEKKAQIVLGDIDLSRPATDNIKIVNERVVGQPQEIQDKALALYIKNQELYNKAPADYFHSKNPNATPSQVQEWLNSQGKRDQTAIPSQSQFASAIKSDFNRLGTITTPDKQIVDKKEQFDIIYKNGLEKFTYKNEKTGKLENDPDLFAKEVKIHGDGLDYMMVQAKIDGNDDLLNTLINVKIDKNSPEGLQIKKSTPAKAKDILTAENKALKYLKATDPLGYEKLKTSILDVSNATNKSINDVANEFYKKYDFVVDDNLKLKIDKEKYDVSDVKTRITTAKRNAKNIFAGKNDVIGKYDLAENLVVSSNSSNGLDFVLLDQKGNKDYLGTLAIDDLPQKNYITPAEKFAKQFESNFKSSKEKKTFKDIVNDKFYTPEMINPIFNK